MTYPLLQQAPKDHHSEEFLDFLRENNQVLWEDEDWLCIKNCKYNRPTAFIKRGNITSLIEHYPNNEWLVKPANKRTVKRFHVHIINLT